MINILLLFEKILFSCIYATSDVRDNFESYNLLEIDRDIEEEENTLSNQCKKPNALESNKIQFSIKRSTFNREEDDNQDFVCMKRIKCSTHKNFGGQILENQLKNDLQCVQTSQTSQTCLTIPFLPQKCVNKTILIAKEPLEHSELHILMDQSYIDKNLTDKATQKLLEKNESQVILESEDDGGFKNCSLKSEAFFQNIAQSTDDTSIFAINNAYLDHYDPDSILALLDFNSKNDTEDMICSQSDAIKFDQLQDTVIENQDTNLIYRDLNYSPEKLKEVFQFDINEYKNTKPQMYNIFCKLFSLPYNVKKKDYIRIIKKMSSTYHSILKDDEYSEIVDFNEYFNYFKAIISNAKKTYFFIVQTAEQVEFLPKLQKLDKTHSYHKYINEIRQLCFEYSTQLESYVAKREIFNIVQFLPEFFHYLKFKIDHLLNQNQKNDELYIELEVEYNTIQTLLTDITLLKKIENLGKHFSDFSEKELPLFDFRKNIFTYLNKYHEGSTSHLIYFVFFKYSYKYEFLCENREHSYILLSICFTLKCTDLYKVFEKCIRHKQYRKKDVISKSVFYSLLGSKKSSIITMQMTKIHGSIEMEMFKVAKTHNVTLNFQNYCLLVNYDENSKIQVRTLYLSRLNWIKYIYTQYRLYALYV